MKKRLNEYKFLGVHNCLDLAANHLNALNNGDITAEELVKHFDDEFTGLYNALFPLMDSIKAAMNKAA